MIFKTHPILTNYSFSKCGKALYKNNLKALRLSNNGYWIMRIHLTGKRKDFLVHRLMWQTFKGEIPLKYEINHKDGVKSNNHLSNLECVTPRENNLHARRTGLFKSNGEKNKQARLTQKQVNHIRKLYKEKVFNQYQLASKYKVSQRMICKIVRYEKWRYTF